jgi:hypothetical protein
LAGTGRSSEFDRNGHRLPGRTFRPNPPGCFRNLGAPATLGWLFELRKERLRLPRMIGKGCSNTRGKADAGMGWIPDIRFGTTRRKRGREGYPTHRLYSGRNRGADGKARPAGSRPHGPAPQASLGRPQEMVLAGRGPEDARPARPRPASASSNTMNANPLTEYRSLRLFLYKVTRT